MANFISVVEKSYKEAFDALVAENVARQRNPPVSKDISNRFYYVSHLHHAEIILVDTIYIAQERALHVVTATHPLVNKLKEMVSTIGIIREQLNKAVEFVPVESALFLDDSISPRWIELEYKADALYVETDAAYRATLVSDREGNVYSTDDAVEAGSKAASVLSHCIVRLKSVFYHLGMAESRCNMPQEIAAISSLVYDAASRILAD